MQVRVQQPSRLCTGRLCLNQVFLSVAMPTAKSKCSPGDHDSITLMFFIIMSYCTVQCFLGQTLLSPTLLIGGRFCCDSVHDKQGIMMKKGAYLSHDHQD